MVVFVVAFILLAATCGFLGRRLAQSRDQLRTLRQETAVGASLETEKLAILQEANEVLRQKNGRLRSQFDQTQQELVSLDYSISHDLRAPLRSINGFSQALAEDYGPRLDGSAQDYLRRLRAGALQLNALIDDLLSLSQLVRAPFHPARLDLSLLAWDVVRALAGADPGRRVEWDIQPGITGWGDRALLGEVLRQLLGNAWKFSAKRAVAHIAFRARPAETGTIYEVRDDGAGFDVQYAGRLFGVFQRMHTTDEFPGRGAGLAKARRIVRRHGGDIRASAVPDQGAVFSFTLEAGSGLDLDGIALLPPLPAKLEAAADPAQPRPTVV